MISEKAKQCKVEQVFVIKLCAFTRETRNFYSFFVRFKHVYKKTDLMAKKSLKSILNQKSNSAAQSGDD